MNGTISIAWLVILPSAHLVSIGTSVISANRRGLFILINIEIGSSKKSTSPIRTLAASAPVGIFLKKSLLN